MTDQGLPILPAPVESSKTPVISLEQFRRHQREFIKLLRGTSGGEAPWRKFEWWVEMAYCAMAKASAIALHQTEKADALEARYMRLREVAGPACQEFPHLFAIMALAMEESGGRDFLSSVASDEDVSALNKGAGQFFTPFDVSRLLADISLGDVEQLVEQLVEQRGYVTMSEPCSGAGGMLLAAAQVFRDRGLNPTTQLWFEAGDVATLCHQMTYIQTSLAGMSGRVVQQNALTLETPSASDFTIGAVMFIARRGVPRLHAEEAPAVAAVPFSLVAEVAASVPTQADLFGG